MQEAAGSTERKAAAQAKRDRRRAKRAGGPSVIVLSRYPNGTVSKLSPDGAYIWDGGLKGRGFWQLIVVGHLKGSVDDYRAAAAAWLKKPLVIRSAKSMGPASEADAELVASRGFLDIILELDDGLDRGPIEAIYAPAGQWPNHEPMDVLTSRFRNRPTT